MALKPKAKPTPAKEQPVKPPSRAALGKSLMELSGMLKKPKGK